MSRFGEILRVTGMTLSIDSPALLFLATIALFGASALLPVMATEPLLLALSAMVPASMLVPVTLLATATHMAAKALVYLGSRNAGGLVSPRRRAMVERTCGRLSGRRPLQLGTVFVSAVAGLPPFYVLAMAWGVLRLPLADFMIAGFMGRAIRFGAIVAAPQLLWLS